MLRLGLQLLKDRQNNACNCTLAWKYVSHTQVTRTMRSPWSEPCSWKILHHSWS